jgi:hypothetical protein
MDLGGETQACASVGGIRGGQRIRSYRFTQLP